MRVLITGAAGFIGSHLADALVDEGEEVVGFDDCSTGRAANFPSGHRLVIGDIRHHEQFPAGPWDLIFHCAASYRDRDDWERDASTNVLGTINTVRVAAENGAKIVYFQTSLCYGPSPSSPIPTNAALNPVGSYAVSKTAGESYIRDSGVPFVSLRLANIYGPRNLSGPIPTFYQRLSSGQDCTVVNSRRDFVYIDDLVDAAIRSSTEGAGVYHVSSGRDYSIYEIYDSVAKAMDIDRKPTVIERGPDDVATILLDPTETNVKLDWSSKSPLWLGIRNAVEWYRRHGVTETYTHLAMKG